MRLVLSKKEDFPQIYAQMQKNFCLDEIRDYPEALAVYDDAAYRLYHLVEEGERVGFIAVWEFDSLAFVEHFVIYEAHRNRGFGGIAIQAVQQRYERVLLEVEPPEEEMAIRRFAFYQRQGFQANDYEYMQPSYRENGNEVRLILMSSPTPLSDIEKVVQTIRQKVYKKE